MKKVLFILLVLISFNAYADSCSKEELARLKNIANQVELSYEYEKKTKKVENGTILYHEYSIIAHNLNEKLKVNYEIEYLTGKYKTFKNIGNNVGKLSGFNEGDTVNVTIRAYTSDECAGKVLAKKSIKLPYMNPFYYYYNNCDDYPDFKYCVPELDEDISYEKFMGEFHKYLEKKESTTNEINNVKESNNMPVISLIILLLILLIGSIIAFIFRKNKKDRL